MALLRRLLEGVRAALQNRRVEQELDDEVREYLDTAIEQKVSAGMTRAEAVRAARVEMGSLEAVKDRVRDVGWESRVEALGRDLRYGLRMLRRSPGVSAVAVVTIATGVGAATSRFSVMRSLLLAPPPHVVEPGRVFRLHQMFPAEQVDGEPDVGAQTSYPFYELIATRAKSLDGVAAYTDAELAVGTGSAACLTRSAMVSADFWRTLGVRPALGRFIQNGEAHPARGSRVVVLGHAFWRGRFGGSADAIGQTLTIKGQPYEVIGVAPRGFRGVELADVDLWLPLFASDDAGAAATWHTYPTSFDVTVVARLKPDVTREQAAAELTSLQRPFLEEAYATFGVSSSLVERNRRARVVLGSVTGGLGGDLRPIPEARVSMWLVGVAFVLFAIAGCNVAGLLLLRAVQRRREIAVRLALGASRRRLARQLLTESSILALLGGSAALVTAVWAGAWLQRTLLPTMAWEPTTLSDPSVITVAALLMLGAAFVSGMAPLYYMRADGASVLRAGLLRGSGKQPPLLSALLAVQGALSVVLLVGAGLFMRSMHNAQTVDIGLDRDNVLAVQIDFSGSGRTSAAVAAFFEQALERVAALPGVTRASLAMDVPLRRVHMDYAIRLPGRDTLPTLPTGGPYVNEVTPGFFATVGMRLQEGREFLDQERNQSGVAIVNETIARLYWPGRSPLGECVYLGRQKTCTTVVGVVADARRFRIIEEERYLYYYRPLATGETGPRALLVRVAPGSKRLEATLRRTIVDLDPNLPLIRIETLGEALDPQIWPWRLGASVFTAFGALSVILALIGLWSSVAYAVSQRTQEFAIRMALGAQRASLISLVLKGGMRDALVAVTGGVVLALLGSRYMTDLLYGVSPSDPIVFTAVAAGILTVATLANLLPAWRVSGIDPAAALRAD